MISPMEYLHELLNWLIALPGKILKGALGCLPPLP